MLDQTPAQRGLPTGLSAFVLGGGAMFAAMYETQAVLPELARAFGVSAGSAGLTISVSILGVAVGSWIWGPASDRLGRRRTLIASCGLLAIPSLLLALAPTFGVLLALRAAQGLCMAGLLTVGVPYVAETFSPRIGGRAAGWYLVALVGGGLVGRLWVAGMAEPIGWRGAFLTLGVTPVVAAALLAARLPDAPSAAPAVGAGAGAPAAPARGRPLQVLAELARNGELRAAIVAGCGLFCAFIAIFTYVGFRLAAAPFSLSPATASLVFGLWAIGLLGPRIGGFTGRVGWRTMALACLVAELVGFALTLVGWLPAIIAGLALVVAGDFFGVAATQMGMAEALPHRRGVASAAYFSSYYVAGGLGGFLPGLTWGVLGWTGVVMVAMAAAIAGVVGLVADQLPSAVRRIGRWRLDVDASPSMEYRL